MSQYEMPHPVGWGHDTGGGSQPETSTAPRGRLSPRGQDENLTCGSDGGQVAKPEGRYADDELRSDYAAYKEHEGYEAHHTPDENQDNAGHIDW